MPDKLAMIRECNSMNLNYCKSTVRRDLKNLCVALSNITLQVDSDRPIAGDVCRASYMIAGLLRSAAAFDLHLTMQEWIGEEEASSND